MRRLLLLVSVVLAGVSGVGLEVLFLSSAGLALGYGRSTAMGLAVFIAAWALGAYLGGRQRASTARALLVLGVVTCLFANPALRILLYFGSDAPGGVIAASAALILIALVAGLQGAFLPLFARAMEQVDSSRRDVSVLVACSFAGSVLGAYGIGQQAVAEFGRSGASLGAGVIALAAGGLAAFALRGVETRALVQRGEKEPALPAAELNFARAAWIVGLATAWLSGLEWIGLRLGVLWLSGMQPALTAVLCASLLALALGAFVIPRVVPATTTGVIATVCVCAVGAIWPVHAALAMRLLGRSAEAIQSTSISDSQSWLTALERVPDLVRALVLVGPSLCVLGAIVPLMHRLIPRPSGTSGERLGRLYLHETWGALIGVPCVHFVLVPALGLAGATAVLMSSGALMLIATYSKAPRASIAAFVVIGVLAAWTALQRDPALDTPPLSNPAFTLRSFRHDRNFAVAVVDDGQAGERTLLTDGFRAAGTGHEYTYMSMLGHLPILLHERPRRAAVLALGTGTTLGAVALHPEVERIDVLEISPAVVDAATWFEAKNHGVLKAAQSDPGLGVEDAERVRVRLGDGRHTLSLHSGEYDVITMEPLLPDSPFAVYLYTREFYARAQRALATGGILCQWVPPHALEPETFAAVLDAFRSSFAWSSVWLFGTQVILIASDRVPVLDPQRFTESGPDLVAALRDLGIETPRGLLARFVSSSAMEDLHSPLSSVESRADVVRTSDSSAAARSSGYSKRPLTDEDPWIAYRPRRSGAALLGDLPENLGRLRRQESDPPASWMKTAGPDAPRVLGGVRALHAAREAHARDEARLRGARIAVDSKDPELAKTLEEARSKCGKDPELADLEREIAFLGALRRGISALSSDRSRAGAEAALSDLLRATELARERTDVHLYMAAALSRLQSPAAPKALEAALARCPRAAETIEGRRAHELGLAADLWERAELSAAAASRSAR